MSEQEKKVQSEEVEAAEVREKPAKKEKEKEKKPNFFVRSGKRIVKWARDLKSEMKKIVWPTGKQVINNTLIVIACIFVIGVFVWVLDFLFTKGRDLLISLK